MEETIKFNTTCFGYEVNCYLKPLGYDVYINRLCIKMNASLEWVMMLQTLLTKMD